MKNNKIIQKITQGMYVLTTQNGGCIVDAVSKISAGENPLIAVSVKKNNYTNTLLRESKTFALSVLGEETNLEIIEIFGMHSMKEVNKFEKVETIEVDNLKVIKDSLGYMILEMIGGMDNDTHTLFVGKVIEADLFEEKEPMSYSYYEKKKKNLIKNPIEKEKNVYFCTICGYSYDEELKKLQRCPICGVGKELFTRRNENARK